MIFRPNSGQDQIYRFGLLSVRGGTVLACIAATLSFSLPANAVEWGDIYLGAGADRFFFGITVLNVPPSASDHIFRMYTKSGIIVVPSNQEQFIVVMKGADGSIVDGPRVEPIETPDLDRWVDGPVTDVSVFKSDGGTWTMSGAIVNGTQPYVSGDLFGEIRFSYSGGTIGFSGLVVGDPPPAAMWVTKTSTTRHVTTVGQVVPYEYVVYNTGQIVLHDIALNDDNVDSTPVCVFPGNDELAVEGEPGSSVVCTAQHTVTQEEINTKSVVENTVTATSDEAEPVTASYSIPIAIFADGFE